MLYQEQQDAIRHLQRGLGWGEDSSRQGATRSMDTAEEELVERYLKSRGLWTDFKAYERKELGEVPERLLQKVAFHMSRDEARVRLEGLMCELVQEHFLEDGHELSEEKRKELADVLEVLGYVEVSRRLREEK